MSEEMISYEVRGDVALIGLNRPEKRNAISDSVVEQLALAVQRAESDAKAGVIYGNGKHFCAGLDLAEHVKKSPIQSIQGSRRWHSVFGTIQHGSIPWVSALHGAVVGGGFELAASTHIRVASTDAFFALPEGQRGIFVGGGGSVRIARLINVARMTDMMLTGRVASASEIEQWGGVQYVVPEGEALDKAISLAEKTAGNTELTNFSIIHALPRIQDMSKEDGLLVESVMAAFTSSSPEAEQRLNDFLSKRTQKVQAPDV